MTTESYDVAVVGGGPSGSSAGVFTGRYDLDTVVFDAGNAALARSAYLTNYLGFPEGVDIPTFYDLMDRHVREAGCEKVEETVDAVEHEGNGFRVETADGTVVSADDVIAAAWYDGSYLRPLGDELFVEERHGGETTESLDPDYADAEGRTPVDGLYIAAPAARRNTQAIIAAGNGARVARGLIEDRRRERGYPEGVVPYYDWVRKERNVTGEWAERDRWREWFATQAGEHDLSEARFEELRETYIDDRFEQVIDREETDARKREGTEALVMELGPERVLDALDDETIAAYLKSEE